MKSLSLITGSLILLYNLSFSQIKVASTGKVKIGATTDPSAILDIKGNTYTSYFYTGTNEDTYIRPGKSTGNVIFDYGKIGIGISAPSSLLNIHGPSQNLEISNTTENAAGILFYDHGNESTEYGKILFNSASPNSLNLYCSNSNPAISLQPALKTVIKTSSSYGDLIFDNTGWLGMSTFHPVSSWAGNLGTSDHMWLTIYGDEISATVFTQLPCDINLKTNFRNIINPVQTLGQIRGVKYDLSEEFYKNADDSLKQELLKNKKNIYGFIAQELEEVLP